MTKKQNPLCAECEKARYKKKEWYVCRQNCVHHALTDACMNPEWFEAIHSSTPAPDEMDLHMAYMEGLADGEPDLSQHDAASQGRGNRI